MNVSGNTILITGGGSGIGAALAHRWHDLGNDIVITGRRRDVLDRAIQGRKRMTAMELDVDDPAAIVAFAREVRARYPSLNVLVNNAGIMRAEDLTGQRDLTDAVSTVTTNLLGPIRMIDALVDHLKAQANAAIVTVSSGLAFVPLVPTPTYSATKAAIHSYSIALREQLRGQVDVIEIVPPAVQTELTPGQSTRDGYLPLDAFADEVMNLFARTPTPEEILVERVAFLRTAESEGRFARTLATLNAH